MKKIINITLITLGFTLASMVQAEDRCSGGVYEINKAISEAHKKGMELKKINLEIIRAVQFNNYYSLKKIYAKYPNLDNQKLPVEPASAICYAGCGDMDTSVEILKVLVKHNSNLHTCKNLLKTITAWDITTGRRGVEFISKELNKTN